jgi:hypothetical protein
MKRVKTTVEEFWLSAAELAEALKLSPGRISQLTSAGVLERDRDGLYDLSLALICYERFLWRGASDVASRE